MYIYEVQFDFMQKNHQKHSNGENRRFYYVNLAPKARNHEKSLFAPPTETRITHFFLTMYAIYWVVSTERAVPGLSEYVWDLSISMILTPLGRSKVDPHFEKKIDLGRCYKK